MHPILMRTVAALAALLAAGSLFAESNSRIVMPFAAGGASDVLARMVAAQMQRSTGTPTFVENIAGANGNIGAATVARAAPDGKTILITSEAYTTVNPLLFKGMVNPSDLDPLTILAVQPAVLAVKADGKLKTFDDFIQKARTSGVTYSSAGVGSTSHLATQYLASVLGGMQLTHVPYKGGAPAITALLTGEVDAGFIVSGNVIPHLNGGKLIALAVASEKRLPQMPNVPTIAELTHHEFVVENAVVLLVPARTPAPVKEQLAGEVRKAVDTPEIGAYLEKNGYVKMNSNAQDARRWLAREKRRWTDLLSTKNILKD
jgi:tripartite-type tricarboxylate transporter receptor subunit TctC